jgi:Family of unknown function (DUF6496)
MRRAFVLEQGFSLNWRTPWRTTAAAPARTWSVRSVVEKKGKLKSGKGGKGGVVKSRKQAIAIGLSEARKKGKKVPGKKSKKKG